MVNVPPIDTLTIMVTEDLPSLQPLDMWRLLYPSADEPCALTDASAFTVAEFAHSTQVYVY